MIVKRLVCIEDLGNVQVLFTDKTGTLTEGHISFTQPLDYRGDPDDRVRAPRVSPAATRPATNSTARSGSAADPTAAATAAGPTLDLLPFDHERQLASVLVDSPRAGC